MNRSKQAGMTVKTIVVLLVGLALASVRLAEAQPTKVPRIGYVSGTGNPSDPGPNFDAFRQGLRDLGYTEGKNILVEYRYAEGKLDRIPSLVAELVQLKVDVLVSGNLPSIRAAKHATKTIPIVIVTLQDPIRPDSDYGTSKAFGEAVARQYHELYGIESVCLRIGTVLADDDPRKNKRFLKTWLSHDDLVQLVKKGISSENVKFGIYYGVSNNKGRFWDISNAEQELDFHPQDDASSLPMLSRQ
jgi:hypothetical protein